MRPILGALTATDKALFGVPPTSPIVGPSESLARANPADHLANAGMNSLCDTYRCGHSVGRVLQRISHGHGHGHGHGIFILATHPEGI
jgi:hypothetical protein